MVEKPEKPEKPVDSPVIKDAAPVKEEAVPSAKVEPPLTCEDDEGKLASPTELVESLVELKNRAKAAGKRPLQNMVTGYISQGIAMIDGLLEAFEGSKRKKGK